MLKKKGRNKQKKRTKLRPSATLGDPISPRRGNGTQHRSSVLIKEKRERRKKIDERMLALDSVIGA